MWIQGFFPCRQPVFFLVFLQPALQPGSCWPNIWMQVFGTFASAYLLNSESLSIFLYNQCFICNCNCVPPGTSGPADFLHTCFAPLTDTAGLLVLGVCRSLRKFSAALFEIKLWSPQWQIKSLKRSNEEGGVFSLWSHVMILFIRHPHNKNISLVVRITLSCDTFYISFKS